MPERLLQIEEPVTRLTPEIKPSDIQSRLEEINSLQNDLYQLEATIIQAQLPGSERSHLLTHLDELTRFGSLLELRLIDLHQKVKTEEKPPQNDAILEPLPQQESPLLEELTTITEAEQEEQALDDLTEQIEAPSLQEIKAEALPMDLETILEAPVTNEESTQSINETKEEPITTNETIQADEPIVDEELERLLQEQAQAFALAGQWHHYFQEQAASIQPKLNHWLNTQIEAEERIRELEHSIQSILSEEMQLDGTIFSADQLLDGGIENYIQQRLQTIHEERMQLETAYEQAQSLGWSERKKAITSLDEALSLLQTNETRYLQRLRRLPNIKAHFQQRLAEPAEELQVLIETLQRLSEQQNTSKQALAQAHQYHQQYRSHALTLGQYFATSNG